MEDDTTQMARLLIQEMDPPKDVGRIWCEDAVKELYRVAGLYREAEVGRDSTLFEDRAIYLRAVILLGRLKRTCSHD